MHSNMDILTLCSAIQSSLHFITGARTGRVIDHSLVEKFQEGIKDHLNNRCNVYKWEIEQKAKGRSEKDSIDILGQAKGLNKWIIEIDATRSDQVSQKLLSRLALWGLTEPMTYVAILYPDTRNGKNACEKYLRYANAIVKRTNKHSCVVGIFVDPAQNKIEIQQFNEPCHFEVNGKECKTMSDAAAYAIKEYLAAHNATYASLVQSWGKYVNFERGASRYKNTGICTADGITVHSFTQFRQYGLCSYWSDFVRVCKSNGVSVNKMNKFYVSDQLGERTVYKA